MKKDFSRAGAVVEGRTMMIGIAIALLFTTVSSANVIGDLKTSSGNGTATVTLTSLTFNTDTSANPPGPPWNSEVANTTDLMFAGCPSGVLGTAGCLDAAPFAPAEGVEFANNIPIVAGAGLGPNNPFIQFAGNGVTHAAIDYFIAALGAGSANTNCTALVNIGDSCSVFAGSPIILTLTATGTSAAFSASGTVTDGTGTSNWVGQFSTPISGMTPAQIQLFFCPTGTCTAADFASGRSITKPYGGDFLANVVPEPGTVPIVLVGVGLIALGVRKRRSAV